MIDADAHGDEHFRDAATVVANLQNRSGTGDIEAVVRFPRQAQCLAQTTRSSCKQTGCCARRQTTVCRHQVSASYGFKGPQQHASRQTLSLATDVHAKVAAVNRIHVGVARRSKEHLVPRSGSAMGMRGRVGRVVMGAEIGLDLDDSARHDAVTASVHQQLSKQAGADKLGRALKKTAWQQPAGGPSAFPGFRIEISTPWTKTCPRGPRTWGTQ